MTYLYIITVVALYALVIWVLVRDDGTAEPPEDDDWAVDGKRRP